MPTYQVSEYVQEPIPEGVYNLNVGMPSPSLLPVDLMNRLRLEIQDPTFLTYAAEQGYRTFRKIIASFLETQTGKVVDPDTLMKTSGNSSVIEFLSSRVVNKVGRGGYAFVESPTYYYGADTIRHAGLDLVFIPVDGQGMVVEEIEQKIQQGIRPALVYVIPGHQNPTSACLSQERAQRLVELAEAYDFLILADDPYHLLSFVDKPRVGFAGLEPTATINVIAAGSFSKIFAPAVRLGWLQAHPERIAWLVEHPYFVSGGGLNPVMAALLSPLVADGSLAENILVLRRVLSSRKDALVRALKTYLPDFSLFAEPRGGYFVWGTFPAGMDTVRWGERLLAEQQVVIRPGPHCHGPAEGMRLSYAFHDEGELEEGVRRMGVLVEELRG